MSARDDYPNLFALARTEAGLFTELLILEAGSAIDELDYLHSKLTASTTDRPLVDVIRWMMANQFIEIDSQRRIVIIDGKLELTPDELAAIEYEMGRARP